MGPHVSRSLIAATVGAGALFVAVQQAAGFTGGAVGYSGKGGKSCGECHQGGKEPQGVVIKGPTSLVAGATGSYVVVISGASPKATIFGGYNVAAGAGELRARAGSKVEQGEVTQGKLVGPANPIELKFEWVAPAQPGPVTLHAAGLAADGSGSAAGDASKTTTLQVEVTAAVDLAMAPPDLAGADLLGLDFAPPPPDFTPPPDLTEEEPPSPDLAMGVAMRRDEPRWGCGCAVGERGDRGGGRIVAALIALLLFARRRLWTGPVRQ